MITASDQLAAEMMAQAAQLERTAQGLLLQAREIRSKFAPKRKAAVVRTDLVSMAKAMGAQR